MFNLSFATGNAAFAEYPAAEVCRILRDVARRIEEDGVLSGTVPDANGNRVGSWLLDAGDAP
jgi:hypothetical protein